MEQLATFMDNGGAIVHIGEKLSSSQKTEFQTLVSQVKDVFSVQPGQTSVIHHDIVTPPGVVIKQRPYRVPEAYRLAIQKEVKKMLKLGVIKPYRSLWSTVASGYGTKAGWHPPLL